MKHKTVNTIKQGKKSGMRITTIVDDETGIKTHDIFSWRGRRTTRQKIVWNIATNELISINDVPVVKDDSVHSLLSYAAATALSNLAAQDDGQVVRPDGQEGYAPLG